jgi:hypothetical protein
VCADRVNGALVVSQRLDAASILHHASQATPEKRWLFAPLNSVVDYTRAYLRLTQKRPKRATSRPKEPQISLDVLARESPHVVEDFAHRRAE